MTNIVFRDAAGRVKGAVSTHHDDADYIRELAADSMANGSLDKFGAPGDTISVEPGPPIGLANTTGAKYLRRLSCSEFRPYEDEPDVATVSVYQIVSEDFSEEVDDLLAEGHFSGFESLILKTLGLEEDAAAAGPGEKYMTFSVERVFSDMIVVREVASMNI